jgi:hypothetical protein
MEDKHVSVIAAGEHHGAAGLEEKKLKATCFPIESKVLSN